MKPQATAAVGSVPGGVNYQGRLDDNGFPVTGSREMTFRVYDALSGGTLLWNSGAQTISFDRGLFSATLSVSTQSLSGGGARYLEVEVAGTVLSPREAFNAVPYALVAKTVEGSLDISGGGLSISSSPAGGQSLFVSSQTGYVGVGTTNPGRILEVNGNSRFDDTLYLSSDESFGHLTWGTCGAAGTSNVCLNAGNGKGMSFGTNNGFAQMFIQSGGNVGVGTTSPSSPLTVYGDVRIAAGSGGQLVFADGTTSATAGFGSAASISANGDGILTGDADANAAGDVILKTGSNDRLHILNNGNVGIGSVAPTSKLLLSSGTFTIDGTSPGISVGGSTFTVAGGNVGIGTISPATKLHMSSGTLTIDGNTANSIVTAGNIGIGTTIPATRLELSGTHVGNRGLLYLNGSNHSYIGLEAPPAGQAGFFLNRGGSAEWIIGMEGSSGVGDKLYFSEGTSLVAGARVTLVAGGNVGIGTASPATKLHMSSGTLTIDGTSPGMTIGVSTFVVAGGNVGLGTSAPATKLHLSSGTLTIDGTSPGLEIGVSTFVVAGGAVGIGTSNPAYKLAVSGDIAVALGSGGRYYFSDGSSQVSAAGASQWAVNVADIYAANSGGVGIGTSVPATKLHISSGVLTLDGTGPGMKVGVSTFVIAGGNIGIGTTNPAAKLQLSSGTLAIDGTSPRLTVGVSTFVVSGGYVGVGTTAPGVRLDVQNDNAADSYVLRAGTATTAYHLVISTVGNLGIGTTYPVARLQIGGTPGIPQFLLPVNYKQAGIATQNVAGETLVNFGANTLYTGENDNTVSGKQGGMIRFDTRSGVDVMQLWTVSPGGGYQQPIGVKAGAPTGTVHLSSAGNVGIGLTSPAARLHVSSASATSSDVIFQASSGTSVGQELLVVQGAGKVGIGTSSPAATLEVRSASGQMAYFYSPATPVQLKIGSASAVDKNLIMGFDDSGAYGYFLIHGGTVGEALNVKRGGNVGVGTTAPAVALDVKDQGEFGLGAFTQAQVNAKTPGKVGTLILNSTLNKVCVSTGTTVMGYARIEDGSTCQ